jgi:hypothetical protein
MKKIGFVIFVISLMTCPVQAQTQTKFNAGIGIGLDYGGFGARLAYLPEKHFALFGGLGYNLNSVGYNAGANIRLTPDKRVVPYLTGMYGYNAVMIVTGALEKKTTYYGPSAGAGIEIPSRGGRSFWNIELLAPFRPSAYQDDIDDLKTSGAKVTEALPVAICIGYHFRF